MVATLIRRGDLLLASLLLASCGGDGANLDCKMVTAAGTPPSTSTVISLTPAQRAQLCDYVACQNGGYGAQPACANGPSVTFAGSRTECLSNIPANSGCLATVQDLLGCLDAIHASPCVSTFFGSSACEAVTQLECLTLRPNAFSVGMASFERDPR
jgi:hypothetical protein